MSFGNELVAKMLGAKGASFLNLERYEGVTSQMPTGMFWVDGDDTMPNDERYFVFCLASGVGSVQIAVHAETGVMSRRVLAAGASSAWAGLVDAAAVAYDPATSSLEATTVQAAIDELKGLIDAL